MSLQTSRTTWILVWIALLLFTAPGQAFSAVPRAGKDSMLAPPTEKQERAGAYLEFASRGGLNDRNKNRRSHRKALWKPKRTSRRGHVGNPSTERHWKSTDKTRPTGKRATTFGSEFNRDSSRFKRHPRSRKYEYFTPSSKEPQWGRE